MTPRVCVLILNVCFFLVVAHRTPFRLEKKYTHKHKPSCSTHTHIPPHVPARALSSSESESQKEEVVEKAKRKKKAKVKTFQKASVASDLCAAVVVGAADDTSAADSDS